MIGYLCKGGDSLKKFYKPFSIAVTAFALIIFGKTLSASADFSGLDMLYWVVLLACFFSESNNLFSHRFVKYSLTGPMTIFLAFYKPLEVCLMTILVLETYARIVIRKREGSKIFNEKWLFNISQLAILLFGVSEISKQVPVSANFEFLVNMVLVLFAYNMVNIFFTYTFVSLYSGQNHLKQLGIRDFFAYTITYWFIVVILIFSYEAYGIIGLTVSLVFIMHTQSSLLTSLTSKELNQRLSIDKMTNAYNRNYFDEIVEMNLSRGRAFTILFIDLDDFKQVNDQHGHVVGDGLLIDFVAILKSLLRKENKVFRYGGDEFCIIFDTSEQAEAVRKRLENFVFMFHTEPCEDIIYYHISLGLYEYTPDKKITYNELIHQVDQNMYADKRKKKCPEEALIIDF